MKTTRHISQFPEETQKIARTIIQQYPQQKLFCLIGELGSGKTTFSQGIGTHFGLEYMQSPTYTYLREYRLNSQFFKKLFHYDLYRISNYLEILPLDFNEIIQEKSHFIIIEWADKILNSLSVPHLEIYFSDYKDNQRIIEVKEIF